MIDPDILQTGLKTSYKAGDNYRKIMVDSGISEQEVDDMLNEAFAWLLDSKNKLVLAEEKLLEFDVVWDGSKYVFSPKSI